MPEETLKPFSAAQRRDLVISVLHPKLAAEKLGIPLSRVLARRGALGLPPVKVQFARPVVGRKKNSGA
jgi:hypothetical protein